ncbi:expressed unknown protein [Seminavis robusta]|uniref:Mannosylglycerate hydrolase MGH1-like glycoside hydrolase domain-containing protein n=1 Tax=Seminavis robusta TaxID=568900 RepID=A0A9N8F384_9STRA|nr:expressed unknown protein [Seminavis robusta]|eukprot:Sro3019_g342180.1 n/a (600) ;mRNA; f:4975-6774
MKDNTNNSSSVSDDSHNAEDHGSDDEEAEPLVLEVDGNSTTTTTNTRGYALKRRPLVQFLGIYVLILLPMAGIGLSTVLLVGHATTSRKKNTSTTTSSSSATEPPATMNDNNDNNNPVTLSTGVAQWDAAFLVAMAEVSENIMANGNFMAGAGWTQLWTRDTSYAVQLGLALLYPQVSQVTLEACTQPHDDKDGHQHTLDSSIVMGTTTWLQDVCGHFNGWPYLSDAIVGAQGAWSLFLATGNTTFLEWAYNMTRSTLTWAELEVYDNSTGLFRGCSSFMESNSAYPTEYRFSGPKVGATKALSTNVLYYNGYTLAAQMEQVLHPAKTKDNSQQLQTKANHLRKAIRSRLWLEDQGYYAYYEEANGTLHAKMEGLGESLLLLAPNLESNQTRIRRLFESVHRTPHGIPCLWPQFDLHREKPKDYASYYHNGRIWPFVQGYWALAAARHKQVDVFQQELDSLVGLAMNSAPMETNGDAQQQPTFAEFYQLDGTYMWKRRRQLWSSAGYLGMILHGLFGMELQVDGILFRPVVPAQATNTTSKVQVMTLENLRYRRALLTLHITGHGNVVDTFAINGKQQDRPFLAADAVGHQKIEMVLKQ